MRSIARITIVLLLLATGAWGQKTKIHYDHTVDFRRYKTYTWTEHRLLTRQSKKNGELIDRALVRAVNAQLRSRGLTEDQGNPDLYVAYQGGSAVADSKTGAAYAPHDLAGWGAGKVYTSNTIPGSVPNVWVTMQGVVLFELTDAKTGTIVWSSLLRKKIKEPGKMPKDVDKIATEIAKKAFQDFPPKPRGK